MKITFEGLTIQEIVGQMLGTLANLGNAATLAASRPNAEPVAGSGPAAFTKVQKEVQEVLQKISETIPVDAPKRARTEKQLANDEKMRVAALARIAAKRAARGASDTKAATVEKPVEKSVDKVIATVFAEPEPDPSEVVRIRQKTIEDLQSAYANGHQQEVFELLSRFGNGAKSFRELPPEAFMPIREAIDKGALT